METPFVGICRNQFSGAGQIPVVDDFVVTGQEFLGLFQMVRQLPGQFVICRAAGFLDHIPGKDAQVHILPAVDVPDRLFLVVDLPGPDVRLLGFAPIMDVTEDHHPLVPAGLRGGGQDLHGQQTGQDRQQGGHRKPKFFIHGEHSFQTGPIIAVFQDAAEQHRRGVKSFAGEKRKKIKNGKKPKERINTRIVLKIAMQKIAELSENIDGEPGNMI